MRKITLLFCSLLLAAMAQAQIIHVPADYPTIQLGIDAANSGDTVLVAEGIYYEQINFLGKKPLTVASRFLTDGDTSHISNTIIDGSQLANPDSASVVYFISGEDTTSILCGFRITGGRGTITDFDGLEPSRAGGGIWISSSGATIRNNQVSENRCENLTVPGLSTIGAGIASAWEQEENWIVIENNIIDNNVSTTNQHTSWIYGAGLSIGNNCRIINNIIRDNVIKGQVISSGWAQGAGAMVASETSLNRQAIIQNNLFRDNSVNSNRAYTGGLLVGSMLLTCSDNTFIGNRAESDLSITGVLAGGMAVYSCLGGTVISGNTFKQNYSEGVAGGLEIESFDVIPKTILVENNYFFDNTAKDQGGAFTTYDVPVKLLNNVFSGNHSERGGAIGLIRANNTNAIHLATMINNSFSRNTAKWGGAIVSNNSNPLILNSIFWGDSAGYGREIYVTANDKVEIANTIIKPSFIAGVLIYGGGILDQDPMFDDTVLLTTEPESPCMNTGKREYTCCNSGESFYACCRDITGQSRPLGGGYEIGAYEYPEMGFPDIQTSLPFDAWPNPFSATVIFGYTLGESSEVLFSVYDSYGKLVAEPVNAFQQKGEQRIEWNAGNLPAGIYYCRLQTGNITVSGKIIKIK